MSRPIVVLVVLACAWTMFATDSARAWRSPQHFELSPGHVISARDSQPSRNPEILTAPDASLVAAWSDQFSIQFGRSFNGQYPEYLDWSISTVSGTAVPTGTANDTSWPAVAVQGTRVALAYLFNFNKTGGGTQHDVILTTGTLTSAAPGVVWDGAPQRITFSEADNAKKVSVAFDASGFINLVWEDAPDGSPNHVIRYLKVGTGTDPTVISNPSLNAMWPVLVDEPGGGFNDRLHIAYAENGKAVERFLTPDLPGIWSDPTLQAGSNVQRLDLAVLPSADGSPGEPIVVYDGDGCTPTVQQVYVAAPGLATTQLSSCSAGTQNEPTIAVRASDRTAYAVWIKTGASAPIGLLESSRMLAGVGWRWWAPEVVPASTGDIASGWFEPQATTTDTGENVLARADTSVAPSGNEIAQTVNPQPGLDLQNVHATPIPGGGVHLSWDPVVTGSEYQSIRIVRSTTDPLGGPFDPTATVVANLFGTYNTDFTVKTPLPTSFDDTAASATGNYAYRLYVGTRGPRATTNYSEAPGYRYGASVTYGSPTAPIQPPPVGGGPAFTIGSTVANLDANAGDGRVDLTWNNPAVFEQIKIVRKPDAPPSSLTDGTLVYTGSGSSFSDTAVVNGTTYYYAVYTAHDGGQLSSPAVTFGTPNPPGAPVTYTAQPTGTYAGNAAGYNLGAVFHVTTDKTLLKLGRVYQPGSTSGNQIALWDATNGQLLFSGIVSPTTPNAYLSTPVVLQAGKQYAVAVKEEFGTPWSTERKLIGMPKFLSIDDVAYNRNSTLSYPDLRLGKPGFSDEDWAMTFGLPTAGALTPASPLSNFVAIGGSARADLSWSNPASFDRVKIVRKAGAAPTGLGDGTIVYVGTGSSFTDTGLTDGTTYYYAAFAQLGSEYSSPVSTLATPALPSSTIAYTAAPTGDYSQTLAYNAGTVFHVTQDKTLVQLGRLYKAGTTGTNQIAIWDEATRTLLYSTTVNSSSPTATLTTPVTLLAGHRYVLAVQEVAGSPWSGARPLTGLPAFLVIDDGAFNRNSTLSYPDLRNNLPGASNDDWTMTFASAGATPVTNLNANAGSGRVDLSWTPPPDGSRIQVVRKVGADPTGPADGTLIFDGVGHAVSDIGVTDGVSYHYAVYAIQGGTTSSAAVTTATPTTPPLDAVRNFRAVPGDGSVDLSWTIPGPTTIAALGDSLTTGSTMDSGGVDSPQSTWSTGDDPTDGVQSHYERLAAVDPLIKGRNFNFAVTGATMAGTLAQADRAVSTSADYVTILAGVNDVCATSLAQATPLETFRSQLRATLSRLNSGVPSAQIFVASIPDVTRIWQLFHTNSAAVAAWQQYSRCPDVLGPYVTDADRAAVQQRIVQMDQVLEDECVAARNCRFDLGAVFNHAFSPSGYSTVDYFHLSRAGQNDLADVTWNAGFWPSLASTQVNVVRKMGSAPTGPGDGSVISSSPTSGVTDTGLVNGSTYYYGVWVVQNGRTSAGVQTTAVPSEYATYISQPTGDYANNTGGYNLGFVFHLTADKTLLKLGRLYSAGSSAPNQVGIWNGSTGTLLYSASISPGSPAIALSQPLLLKANTAYVLGVQEATGSPWSSARVLTGLPSFLVVDDSAYNRNANFSYPNLRNNQQAGNVAVPDDVALTFGRPTTGAITLVDPPTGLTATAGDRKVDLAWTNPSTAFDRVDVVRKTGSPPASPTDGTIVYSGVGTAASDTNLTNGTLYYYGAWAVRGGDVSAPARASATATGVLPDPVTGLTATPGDSVVTLNWANPTSPFDGIQVVRKAGASPSTPSDGTVVYSGTGTTVADSPLTNGTLYYYAVWVRRGTNLSAATRTAATPGTSPLNPITNLVASPGDGQVTLSWTNPASFSSIEVVRKAGSDPTSPTDGTLVSNGVGNSVVDAGLANGTTYHYAIWATRGASLSTPAMTAATPAIPSVTGLVATPGDRRIDLTWTNPSAPFDSVQVVRKAGAPPSAPNDGTLIFDGNSTTASDAGLTNGTVYFYAVWVIRGSSRSAPVVGSGLPISSTNTAAYTAAPAGTYGGTVAGYNLGLVFHVTQDEALVKVGRVYKAGSTAPNQIGIWDEATQALLASATVSPGSNVATLPSAVVLKANKRYVLGVQEAVGSPWSGSRVLTGIPSFLVVDDAAYNRNSAFSYPDLRNNQPGASNEDWAMTFAPVAAAPTTPDPVAALQAVPGDQRVDLSWTNPTTAFDGVQIVRKAGSAPTSLSDGTVVYNGTGAAFSDTGLVNGTTYYYAAWTVYGGVTSAAANVTATPVPPAPSPVTQLRALPGDGQVVVSWTNPIGAFDDVLVVRKTGGVPTTPTDGTTVYSGTAGSTTDTGVSNETTYSYAVWVRRSGQLSAVATASATPTSSPLGPVTNLQAVTGDFQIALSWTNPAVPFDQVRVVRNSAADPASPTDGTTIYSGTGATVTDTGLANGTTYHYAVWVQTSGQFSAPVRVAATPAPGPLLPVTGLQAAGGNFRVDLTWTNPSGRFDAVNVVRKTGAVPTSTSDGTLVYSGTASSFGDTGLTNGTVYGYAVWVLRDGQLSASANATATPVDPTASVTYTTQPTGTYTGTANTYNLGAAFHVTQSETLLKLGRIYKAGSTASNKIGIWDAAAGQLLASATVSPPAPTATLATPLALTAGKQYVIGVQETTGSPWSNARQLTGLPSFLVVDDAAYNQSSTFSYPNLRNNAPGQSNEDWTMTFQPVQTPPPPDAVTSLAAVAGDGRVDLSWTNPTTPFDRVDVVRKAGSPPADASDGVVVLSGSGSSYADTALTNGTTYYYAVWTERMGILSPVTRTTAMPSFPPPGPVTGFVASADDQQVGLSWTNPTGPYDGITVVRKAGGAPANPTDGTQVYSGTGTSTTDAGLTNGTLYYYAVWAQRGGRLSPATVASAVPSAIVTYTSHPLGDFAKVLDGFNVGVVFHVTQSKALLKMGRVYGPGSTAPNQIGLWDPATGTLIASATVSATSPTATLATPIVLQAGKQYVFAALEAAGSPTSNTHSITGLPGFLVLDDTAFNRNSSLSYPDLRNNQTTPIGIADDWSFTFGAPASGPAAPPDPVTSFIATAGDQRVDLAWSNPTTAFDYVQVVRKAGSASTSPADGTLVYSGTGTSASDTGLANGTLYYYTAWTNRSGQPSAGTVASSAPFGAVPDPIFGLQATPADKEIDLAWSNPASPFDAIVVVRKVGAAPTNASDGVTVYSAKGSSYADTGLTNGTTYFYGIWVQRGTSLSAATRANAVSGALTPAPVTNLQAVAGDGQISLSWTNPAVFDQIKIVRNATAAPSSPTDGTLVFNGTGSAYVDTGLVNGTTYYYAAWAVRAGALSTPTRALATPVQPPVPSVTGLHATGGDKRVDLTWSNPTTAFDDVKVIRKAGAPPADPTDGTPVYTGTGSGAADTGLADGTLYYYAVWAEVGGRMSTPARTTALPVDPASVLTYTSTPTGDHANAVGGYNLGFVFHVTQDEALLKLGRIYSAGSTAPNQIGIWEDATGLLLSSATVNPAAPTATLDTPLVLRAGKSYVLGFSEDSGSPWSGGRVLTGLPSFLVVDDSAYNRNSAFSYPDLRNNQTAPVSLAEDWTMAFGAIGAVATAPDPVSGLLAAGGDRRVDLSWTNPTTAFDSVRVIRKTGSAPTDPSDGTVVYTGTGTSVGDSGLANGTTYYYGIWTIRGGAFSAAKTASATPQPPPPDPVTNLATNPGDAQVSLSWTNPTTAFDDVKVVRKAGAAPASVTDGVVVYTGTGTSLTDTALTNGTLYYYAVWVERASQLSPVQRTTATPVQAPLDPVSGLTAQPGDLRVDLSWTPPTTPFDQIQVVRKIGADPTDPTDGTVVYTGTGGSVADTALVNGTSYHYAVWAQRSGRLSAAARATATPVAPPLVPVTGVTATAGNAKVDLAWTNPTIRFDDVTVVRKVGSTPTSKTDGTAIYVGSGTSTSDTGLSNGTTYYYGVWVDRDGAQSSAVTTRATPLDPASVLAYSTQPAGDYANATSYNVGAVFHLTEDKVLLKLGLAYKSGSAGTNQIAVWDAATSTLLASVTVTSSAPTSTLSAPVILSAGRSYVIGIQEVAGNPWSGARVLTGLPNFLVIDDGAFNRNSTLTYPDLRNSLKGASNGDWAATFGAVGQISTPDPVTGLQAAWNDQRIALSWTNPTTPFDLVQVIRKVSSDPATPNDGTVVYSGTATSFTDTGLANGIDYHYGIWILHGGMLSTPARVTSTPNVPVDNVTNLRATAGDLRADLTWTNPATMFTDVVVVRKSGSAPTSPSDGTTVYTGTGTSFGDTGLLNGTTYYYGIWTERTGLLSFNPTRASVTPVAPPLVPVTTLQAVGGNARVALSWTNPSIRIDDVKVVRKAGATVPTSPTDGTVVYTGTGTSFTDSGLTNGTVYSYAVWVERDGQVSTPVTVKATPFDPAGALIYTAQPQGTYGNPGGGYNAGAVFHVTADKVLLKLGRVYSPGSTAGNQIGIWDAATGALVVSVSVTPASPVVTLDAAVVLSAGKQYVLGVQEIAGSPWSSSRGLTGLPASLVIDDAAFNRNSTFSYPDSRGGTPGASNDDWTMTLGATGNVTAPDAVTGFTAAAGDSRVDLSWTNPTTPFDLIQVVRKAGSVPTSPSDGTLVCSGSIRTCSDTGLLNGTTYGYAVWTSRGGVLSTPATATATPLAASVSNLQATAGDQRVDLSWTNPTGPFDQVTVVRKAGSAPAGPTDGTTVYSGTVAAASDTGLTNGTTYYYAAWVYRTGQISSAARASATPVAPPLVPVTGLTAVAGNARVDLSWSNPTIRFDQVVVVRKVGAVPASPADGTTVYTGTGTSYADTGLANGTTFFYGVWVSRDGTLSTAATVSGLPVDPSTAITYTASPTGTYTGTDPSFNLGAVFHVTIDKALTKLGRVYKAGSSAGNTIGIFDGTSGTLLASVSVTPAAPVATLPSPLVLSAGKSYVIGVQEAAGTPWSGARALTGLPGFLVVDDAAYNRNSTLSYPNSRNNTPGQSNEDWTMTFAAVGTSTPPDPVTALAATPGDAKVNLSWTNPTTPIDLVQVVRKQGGSPTSPSDGTVVYNGTGASFSDASLTNGTTYGYGVWTLRNGIVSTAALATATPTNPPVTGFAATAGDTRIDLAWTNPTGAFDQVKIVRKAGSAPADPTDGTSVYTGTGTFFADTAVTNGTTYFYAAWSIRGADRSTPARASATPTFATPSPVTNLQASAGDTTVGLSWSNPSGTFDSIRVVRKIGADPTSSTDGSVVYTGNGTSFNDTGLTNGTSYHYGVWVTRGTNLSAAALVAATPAPGALVGVTGVKATGGSGQVNLTWTNPTVSFDNVVVVRKVGADPVDPTDGATVYTGSGTSASDTGLTNGTEYHYAVWVVRGANRSAAARATAVPYDASTAVAYTAQPTGTYTGTSDSYNLGTVFHVTSDELVTSLGRVYQSGSTAGNQIGIWDAATGALLASVSVTPAAASAPLAIPLRLTAGKSYVLGVKEALGSPWSGTRTLTNLPSFLVIDDGAYNRNSTFSYPDLRNNATGQSNEDWTMGFAAIGTTTPSGAPDPVTALQATPGNASVVLSWTNPTSFDSVQVTARAGADPTDPTDGTVVYTGTGTTATAGGLTNGTSYHFGVWVIRGGVRSSPTRTTATPN